MNIFFVVIVGNLFCGPRSKGLITKSICPSEIFAFRSRIIIVVVVVVGGGGGGVAVEVVVVRAVIIAVVVAVVCMCNFWSILIEIRYLNQGRGLKLKSMKVPYLMSGSPTTEAGRVFETYDLNNGEMK